jgi:hypothetical protein
MAVKNKKNEVDNGFECPRCTCCSSFLPHGGAKCRKFRPLCGLMISNDILSERGNQKIFGGTIFAIYLKLLQIFPYIIIYN